MNIVELAQGCGFDADAMKQYAHRHNPWMMESENVVHDGHIRDLIERFKGYQGSSFVQAPCSSR